MSLQQVPITQDMLLSHHSPGGHGSIPLFNNLGAKAGWYVTNIAQGSGGALMVRLCSISISF